MTVYNSNDVQKVFDYPLDGIIIVIMRNDYKYNKSDKVMINNVLYNIETSQYTNKRCKMGNVTGIMLMLIADSERVDLIYMEEFYGGSR